jgi:heterotetrameric sarcosine oxidase gamma subunit
VSAPETGSARGDVRLGRAALEVTEWIADDESALRRAAAAAGINLAAPQSVLLGSARVTLCVRPGRWLLLAPDMPGWAAAPIAALPAGSGASVDLSSGLAALLLAGAASREVLARGCRLDLDPRVFPGGRAAATLMAQVAVTLAALPGGFLLLTPASTARYFEEWLAASARPFGVRAEPALTFQELCGDPLP